jgi:gamma-glutamyltranspeptidase/glutathione hydrolase/leukotriene-C4 hydrolase
VGLYFLLRSSDNESLNNSSKGAVATGTEECSKIAVEILQKGGSAVDSAVAACLCQGLTVPQSSGLGGGMIATVYIKETGIIETLNSREVAPLAAFKDMYPSDLLSREGGLAIAVPTELKGLYELHKKYGKLKWAEVVQPVIDVSESGYKVTHYLATVLEDRGDKIRTKPLFKYLKISSTLNFETILIAFFFSENFSPIQ